jgi:hypothetical protein
LLGENRASDHKPQRKYPPCRRYSKVVAAMAHHSLAMFDKDHPIGPVGIVRELQFTSPHALIVLEVKGLDARPVIWKLEGDSA